MSEPVAWRNLCVGNIGEDSEWIYNEIGQGEPLYTHPVKELTDEEINAEMLSYLNSKIMGLEDFAKAILRKAQEK
jgi:myosin-crossreactive antigen